MVGTRSRNDNDADDDDDGEQSWRGVTDGDDDVASVSVEDIEGASFEGEDSGFGTESGDEFDVDRNLGRGGATSEEDEEDVLDSLLDVLGD
jgi:hypothetical protein